MKKNTSFLVIFILLFVLLGFNAKPASATTPLLLLPYPDGCSSTQGYSPTTGVKCDSYVNTSLPAGCTSTLGYSPLTGTKCDSPTNNPALPAGCTSTLGYSPLTGVKCDSSGVTPSYPPGCTSNSGFSVTTGQSCGLVPTPVGGPVISGVSGPQSLSVNQQGTWSVTARDSSGGSLSYHVDWGEGNDNPYGLSTNSLNQQSATFTHAYSSVGIRTVTFEVKNNMGKSAQTSLSVSVGSIISTQPSIRIFVTSGNRQASDSSMTVNVGDTFIVSGMPQNLQGSATAGNYSRAFFFDQGFSNNNCVRGYNSADDTTWTMTCDAKVAGSSYFYVEIYKNGQTYKSNTVNVTVSGTTTSTTITSISPISAKVGDTVTIYGLNFDTVAPFIYLTNGYLAKVLTPITSSSTQISFSVPSDLSVGAYTVQAISRANSTSSNNSVSFTVVAATTFSTPTISSILPDGCPSATVYSSVTGEYCGNVRAGDTVYINGSNFIPNNYAFFYSSLNGNLVALDTNFISSTRLSFIVPSGELAGPHGISLKSTNDNSFQSNAVSLNFINVISPQPTQVPTISYLSPSSGVVDSTLTINGNGFTLTGNAVDFGFGYIPDLTSASGNQITFIVPESLNPRCRFSNPPCMIMTAMTQPGNYNVSVSNMNGTSNILNFTVVGNVLGATAFHFTLLLKLGSNGNEVLELQKFLNAAGYDAGVADGNFGAKTEAAIIKLQTANGLKGDGVVGALTRTVLNK